jgi:hypothetical protein
MEWIKDRLRDGGNCLVRLGEAFETAVEDVTRYAEKFTCAVQQSTRGGGIPDLGSLAATAAIEIMQERMEKTARGIDGNGMNIHLARKLAGACAAVYIPTNTNDYLLPLIMSGGLQRYLLAWLQSRPDYGNDAFRRSMAAALGVEASSIAWAACSNIPALAFGSDRDTMFLVFRGSWMPLNCLLNIDHALNVIADWTTNLNLDLTTGDHWEGKACAGFAARIDEYWPLIEQWLSMNPGRRKLYLAGHSLGGAVAQLAGCRIASTGQVVHGIYTFGSPRVGDIRFRDWYSCPHFRFVNRDDAIPDFPCCFDFVRDLLHAVSGWEGPGIIPTYHHAGTSYFIDWAGKLVRCGDTFFGRCAGHAARYLATDLPGMLGCHAISDYARSVAGC